MFLPLKIVIKDTDTAKRVLKNTVYDKRMSTVTTVTKDKYTLQIYFIFIHTESVICVILGYAMKNVCREYGL